LSYCHYGRLILVSSLLQWHILHKITTIIYFLISIFKTNYRNDDCFSHNLYTYFNFMQVYRLNWYFIYNRNNWIIDSEYKLNILHISRNITDDCVVDMHLFKFKSVQKMLCASNDKYIWILDNHYCCQTINSMDYQVDFNLLNVYTCNDPQSWWSVRQQLLKYC